MLMENSPAEIKEKNTHHNRRNRAHFQVTRKLRNRNPVVEDYTSSGEQMINLDKSSL